LKTFASVLLAIGCLVALPCAASAATYTVDSTGDEVDKAVGAGGCETAAGKCTLRGAIEESNESEGTLDQIHFAAAFDGKLADTIALGSSLPVIEDPVHIDGDSGGQCATEAGQAGPCAGVNGPASGSALLVEAEGVEIDGLAITGAAGSGGAAGIFAINGSEGFVARDNWLGVKLDGSAGANSKGIYIDPGSDEATIGGTVAADRNVFANNGFEGLDIEGASNTDVLGNYFGVKPDGSTAAANNKDIEITDTVAFEATGNEVGTTVASGVAPCDGGCNVISGAAFAGIDLQGNGGNEEPATGPITIHGNFVGLNAAGTATVANASYGVYVGKATNALIGGAENADANFIAGGGEGIAAESAEGFEAIGNVIGSGAAGAEITAPGKGVFLLNLSNANPVAVSQNVFEMDGGIAVEARFGGAEIVSNFVEGAELGVYTKVGPGGAGGNLIEDNVIGESLANGIRIEDAQNEVLGNAVYQSGESGILLENPVALLFPTENLIGGNAPTDENNINESGGPAIEIVDESGNTEEDSLNEVGRNRGAKNASLFIDLVGAANAGILPPSITSATLEGASGSGALPGAKVRVFRKKTAEAGELESFLGEATADGGGSWSVAYGAAIPGNTPIAATQTSEGGTSELDFETTLQVIVDGGCGFVGNCESKESKSDSDAPQTKILKGPKAKSHSRAAKLKFSSSEAGSTFQCKLDRKPVKTCRSPKKYKGLKPGKHVFKVWATDAAGNKDPTPAKRKFKILK